MRYAIPTSNGKLTAHFGHCEQFAFIDIDETTKTIAASKMLVPPAHQPGVLPAWLAQEGANIVIAGGMGPRAVDLLRQNQIEVILGAMEDEPEQLVLAHMQGALDIGNNVCDHTDGHGHSCNH